MTTKLPASFLPAKFQVLSGSALKLIAITLMLIDHTGLMILYNYPATTATLFSFGGVDYSWYRIFRDIGRAAFPIFCFLLVEGFLHTHNRKKYGLKSQLLHAYRLEIPEIPGRLSYLSGREFTAPLPRQFQNILKEEHVEENKSYENLV